MIADEHAAINRRLKEITGRFTLPDKAMIVLLAEATGPISFPPGIEVCFLLDVPNRMLSLPDIRGMTGQMAETHMNKMLAQLRPVFPSAIRARLFDIRMSPADCERLADQVRISPK